MAAEPQLRVGDDGRVALRGALGFAEVPGLVSAAAGLFDGRGELTLDLAGVGRGDSAGVALLLEWRRAARRAGCELHYRNLPESLLAIARVCGVDTLLPLDGAAG
ncbi:MAG TPA: STAS domain-containing protein [Gammaproteobacteria bacterium]